MGMDPRDYPRPAGCEDLQVISDGLCPACLQKVLAEYVLSGKATLVTRCAR
jgi:hypothetical protein